ncbi:uncharacterized protein P174DRAFT_440823 [Aspergillus novofumigatus IBT 16806]|uniref:Uncharacterized protein n=1 Tax=Aspergillus novofumigatus (strain IBT 16806) TaxID=1392255 RepID=A0A2I1C7E7_ASPN1|nr:uncharacterized protein P174DRAFT_440823 [Aspergillus novofumigatus IBT 16806]PKX93516.1 hypothetical protein P174DRAFT_440823 [Aspergillus novofumigatus IBT 16806]
MYPWHQRLNTWAEGAGLRIDALGLVTLLGAEEMDRIVGRLVPSHYLDYMPLLGAFVVAGNRFTSKQFGFTLYNISAGIVTTELAGWFSRWLRAQELRQARSVITWEVVEHQRPSRWKTILVGVLLVALPVHGMLIALTVLTADWWGFANVMAMIVSVVVRCILVAQNCAGIDANVSRAQQEARNYNYPQKRDKYDETITNLEKDKQPHQQQQHMAIPVAPKDPCAIAKVIVITDESKAVTIAAAAHLIQLLFTTAPDVPNHGIYQATRFLGWVAFGVHVVTIGMSALYTQICTVVVMVTATILTAFKFGCDDSHMGRRIWKAVMSRKRNDDDEKEAWSYTCWVGSRLKATVSSYPDWYSEWSEDQGEPKLPQVVTVVEKKGGRRRASAVLDLEPARPPPTKKKIVERRQDLYAWLGLTEEEETHMAAWGLMPRNREWMSVYFEKKMKHNKRIGRDGT